MNEMAWISRHPRARRSARRTAHTHTETRVRGVYKVVRTPPLLSKVTRQPRETDRELDERVKLHREFSKVAEGR